MTQKNNYCDIQANCKLLYQSCRQYEAVVKQNKNLQAELRAVKSDLEIELAFNKELQNKLQDTETKALAQCKNAENRISDLEERIKNHSKEIEEYCNRLANKQKECEELKKTNIHIDNNRKCKAKKLKEIEQLLIDSSSGYTDEVMQKIMEIIHKPETVCFENKYEQALDDIEKELKEDINCESQECGCNDFEECLKCTKEHILDIINKVKESENV